jgi:hypothetical protein
VIDVQPGTNSKRGGRRAGAGRRRDVELERMVVDLCTSLGYQGDAHVNPDQVIGGVIVHGMPSSKPSERGIRPASVREASQMVARRRLADEPLPPKARARKEAALAARIRRAYYAALKAPPSFDDIPEIEVGRPNGIGGVAKPL